MIVDDQLENRRLLSFLLRREGHRIIEADDGVTGLETARVEAPDLAVADLLMPGMDGFEFAHRLRQEHGPLGRMPIIFVSAMYLPDEVQRVAAACGVKRILSRSRIEEIVTTVRDVLSSPGEDPVILPRREFSLDLLRLQNLKQARKVWSIVPTLASAADPGTPPCEDAPPRFEALPKPETPAPADSDRPDDEAP